MVSHAFSRDGSFHPSCPVLLPLLGATVARIFTLLKLLAFEILGPELEMLLGEALGSLPVDFWWLPFDLGTRFHYFLCNSATVSSIIKQQQEMRQCCGTGLLSKISFLWLDWDRASLACPFPMFRPLKGLLAGGKVLRCPNSCLRETSISGVFVIFHSHLGMIPHCPTCSKNIAKTRNL